MILCIVVLLGTTRGSYAQTIPDNNWKVHSVSESSVHKYSVTGDQNFAKLSQFDWTVVGGTLYEDAAATIVAGGGDGSNARVNAIAGNISTLYVKWDKDGPGQGYVYAYEVTADGCQQPVTLQSKYSGVTVNKIGKAIARFIKSESEYCSDDGGMDLLIELKGLAPYTLLYSMDGVDQTPITIDIDDLYDLDGDGDKDDYALEVPGWTGVLTEINIIFVIKKISSDGVEGMVDPSTDHTVHIHVLPGKPIITIKR